MSDEPTYECPHCGKGIQIPKQPPLFELTPQEIVWIVQAINSMPDGVMIFNDKDELTMLVNVPEAETVASKLKLAMEREDVAAYVKEYFGDD